MNATILALVLLAQGNPPNNNPQDGGIKTPDMDPYKKNQIDPAKEFPNILSQAEATVKELKAFSAKAVKFHEIDMGQGKDIQFEGSLRGKRIKGEMWALLDLPKDPDQCLQRNVVNKKVAELWPETKEVRRTDFAKGKDAFPIETLLAWQYQPSKYKSDFEIKLVRLALKYKVGDAKYDKPPTDDPFAKEAEKFEKDKPNMDQTGGDGPDANVHHVFELTPKDKKLKEAIHSIVVHVHYRSYLYSLIEVKFSEDGSHVLKVSLVEPKPGGDWKDEEIMIKTEGWKTRK